MKKLLVIIIISLFSCENRLNRELEAEVERLSHRCDSLYWCVRCDTADHYYIVDDELALAIKGIVRRCRGLSREFVPSSRLMGHHFAPCLSDTIDIVGKQPKVLGIFEKDCYKIDEKGKERFELIITNPSSFWRYSSYLIVSHK